MLYELMTLINLIILTLFSSTEIFRELERLRNFEAIECFSMTEIILTALVNGRPWHTSFSFSFSVFLFSGERL